MGEWEFVHSRVGVRGGRWDGGGRREFACKSGQFTALRATASGPVLSLGVIPPLPLASAGLAGFKP